MSPLTHHSLVTPPATRLICRRHTVLDASKCRCLTLPELHAAQLQYFDTIVGWLREQSGAPGSFLHGLLDISKLAVAGHSRGGKLAGLLFAGAAARLPWRRMRCATRALCVWVIQAHSVIVHEPYQDAMTWQFHTDDDVLSNAASDIGAPDHRPLVCFNST